MVTLELQYLWGTGRTTDPGERVVQDLSRRLALQVCDRSFPAVIAAAVQHKWTRDPFDRIIVAQAELQGNVLLTKDEIIRNHISKRHMAIIWPIAKEQQAPYRNPQNFTIATERAGEAVRTGKMAVPRAFTLLFVAIFRLPDQILNHRQKYGRHVFA